ncbi:hypothetical protein DBV39_02425 [Orrella marina]|uniref:Uncharacterized protein n=1 Tax=Orrella marina TaxID=2163011 RepID=A0A2R4XG23_9BURK|nr:hypothetical protein DBV39_02425 [Orrella marina]
MTEINADSAIIIRNIKSNTLFIFGIAISAPASFQKHRTLTSTFSVNGVRPCFAILQANHFQGNAR